jgi:hypothetical protein
VIDARRNPLLWLPVFVPAVHRAAVTMYLLPPKAR